MNRREYVLDLTKAALPSWWPKKGPLVLPIEKGNHYYEWDLIPEKLPAPFYAQLVKIISARMEKAGQRMVLSMPIGFRRDSVPDGGLIRLVGD